MLSDSLQRATVAHIDTQRPLTPLFCKAKYKTLVAQLEAPHTLPRPLPYALTHHCLVSIALMEVITVNGYQCSSVHPRRSPTGLSLYPGSILFWSNPRSNYLQVLPRSFIAQSASPLLFESPLFNAFPQDWFGKFDYDTAEELDQYKKYAEICDDMIIDRWPVKMRATKETRVLNEGGGMRELRRGEDRGCEGRIDRGGVQRSLCERRVQKRQDHHH